MGYVMLGKWVFKSILCLGEGNRRQNNDDNNIHTRNEDLKGGIKITNKMCLLKGAHLGKNIQLLHPISWRWKSLAVLKRYHFLFGSGKITPAIRSHQNNITAAVGVCQN